MVHLSGLRQSQKNWVDIQVVSTSLEKWVFSMVAFGGKVEVGAKIIFLNIVLTYFYTPWFTSEKTI